MGKIMTMKWSKFKQGLDLALKVKTIYAFGGFGWQLNATYKKRLLSNPNNKQFATAINAGNINTWAFDCVCLIKAILWGWIANNKVNYGGAVFKSNGVPDVNADIMMTSAHVNGLSTDFSKIRTGAFVGMKGHIGIYIGDGKVVECTPIWGAKVMVTKLTDRKWVNWGMSKYIDYSDVPAPTPNPKPDPVEAVWVPEENVEIVLTTQIYTRDYPSILNKTGLSKDPLPKGTVVKFVAWTFVDDYYWRLMNDGRVIPTGKGRGNDQQWATIRSITKPQVKPSRRIGSTVTVNGALFTSSGATAKGKTEHKNKKASIDKIADGTKAPFHVIGSGISGWANETLFGNAPVQDVFKPYERVLKSGTVLYQDDLKTRYSLPIGPQRTVKVLEEKNGFGRFEGNLTGVKHAWFKL